MKFALSIKHYMTGAVMISQFLAATGTAYALQQESFGRFKPNTEGQITASDIEQLRHALNGTTQTARLNPNHALNAQSIELILKLKDKVTQNTQQQALALRTHIQQLKVKNVSQAIIAKQTQTVHRIEQRQSQMNHLFDQLAQAKDANTQQKTLNTIHTTLKQWQPQAHQINLQAIKSAQQTTQLRAPMTTQDFKQLAVNLRQQQTTHQLAIQPTSQNNLNTDNVSLQPTQLRSRIASTNLIASNLSSSPNVATLASLPTATQSQDLTANADVQINTEIRQLAAQLNYHPATIYKWVSDHISFVPTYGSIQGSAYTLQTKRGNATDISSLLIALLRASNIPARYVSGTIDVPATMAKTWLGNVNNLAAASNLLGQGGIPNSIKTSGGQETHLRMEHLWVEAKINYYPSKGGMLKQGTQPSVLEAWIPMDASFKQRIYNTPPQLAQALPFKADAAMTLSKSDAFDVGQFNQSEVNAAITRYQNKVVDYLNQQQITSNQTLLTPSAIQPYLSETLSPILPYDVVAIIQDYHTLPDDMRAYFELHIYDQNDAFASTQTTTQFKIPTTALQGQALAVSFKPSTANDQVALIDALPIHSNGTFTPASSLEVTNAIQMTGEITLNGQVLKTLPSYALGSDIQAVMGFSHPTLHWQLPNKRFTAGEYHAIGYQLQGGQEYSIKTSIPNPLQQPQQATAHVLHNVVQSYFNLNDQQREIQANQDSIISYPFMDLVTASTTLQGIYTLGVLRAAQFSGAAIEQQQTHTLIVDQRNQQPAMQTFIEQQDFKQNYQQNLLGDAFFNPSKQSINAVKALQIAHDQKQKIYEINQSNHDNLLPLLQQDEQTLADLKHIIANGKTVITSQDDIQFQHWRGRGYIVLDPITRQSTSLLQGAANTSFILPANLEHNMTLATASVFAMLPDPLTANVVTNTLNQYFQPYQQKANDMALSLNRSENHLCLWKQVLVPELTHDLIMAQNKPNMSYAARLLLSHISMDALVNPQPICKPSA